MRSPSRAPDILPTPNAALRRYAAYVRTRHRFWDAFPGGLYVRLQTPGTDLECGLYALVLSARHQLRDPSSPSSASVRIPTLEELRGVVRGLGLDENWFAADQLAVVFAEWGRMVAGGGVRCQMGWIVDEDGLEEGEGEGWPVMMNTPEVETGEVGDGIVRVWVWNDGLSLRGGVGHFEGIRRPTEGEAGDGDGEKEVDGGEKTQP